MKFLKAIMIILLSILISVAAVYVYESDNWQRELMATRIGIPAGIISGVLFLILNRYALASRDSKVRIFLQVLSFLLIVAITTAVMMKAIFWIYNPV